MTNTWHMGSELVTYTDDYSLRQALLKVPGVKPFGVYMNRKWREFAWQVSCPATSRRGVEAEISISRRAKH